MTVVRRPDQRQIGTSRAGVGPGPSNVVFARVVIVSGANEGVFIYNGTPVLGNPPVSTESNSTSDPFGNPILPGNVSYDPGVIALQNDDGSLIQYYWTGSAWAEDWQISTVNFGTPEVAMTFSVGEPAQYAALDLQGGDSSTNPLPIGVAVIPGAFTFSGQAELWLPPSGDNTGATDPVWFNDACGMVGIGGMVNLLDMNYYWNGTTQATLPNGVGVQAQGRALGIPIGDYGNGGLPIIGCVINLTNTWNTVSSPQALEIQSGESSGTPTVQMGGQILKNFSIDGASLPASSINGIHAFNAAAVTMSEVSVYGVTGDGLHAAAGGAGGPPDFWDVKFCKFSGCNGYGAYVDGLADSWFLENECTGNAKYGWYITNCNNTRFFSCKGEGDTYGFYVTSLAGFTGQVSFFSCTTQQNSLSGFFFTGAGSPNYILTGCRSADDGSGSASAGYAGLQLSGITGTATFEISDWYTGLGTGPACPEYGVSITTCPDTTVSFSSTLANGVTDGIHSDGSATIVCDPSVTFTPVSTADYQTLSNNWLYVGAAGEPGFGGGWASTGGGNAELAFMTERPGVVRIKGYVTNSIGGNTNNIFVLPAGYIPKSQQIFACVENGTVYGNSVVVQTSGDVVMFNAAGGGNYSIDCLISLSI
jgi:hypothetical protein